MASPLGHAIVGVAAASVVAGVTDAPVTTAFWGGTLAASILPDADLALRAFGFTGPRFHRNGSHSLLVLGTLVAVVLAVCRFSDLDWRIAAAWSASLLSHPVLDVLTTGPNTSKEGYGIALFWPIHRRRWSVSRPVLDSLDLSRCRSLRDVWVGVRPELVRLGPLAVIAIYFSLGMS